MIIFDNRGSLNMLKYLALAIILSVSSCSEPEGETSHVHKFFLTTQMNEYVIAPESIAESLDKAAEGIGSFNELSPRLDKPYFIVSYEGGEPLSLADHHQLVLGPMSKNDARALCSAYLHRDGDEGYSASERDEICRLAPAREFLSARREFSIPGAQLKLDKLIFKDVTVTYDSFISAPVATAPIATVPSAPDRTVQSSAPVASPKRGESKKLAQPKREAKQVAAITIAGRNYTFPLSGHNFSRFVVGDVKQLFCSDKSSDYYQLFQDKSKTLESCDERFSDAYARCISLPSQNSKGRRWKSSRIDDLDEALTNVTMLSECVLIQNRQNQVRLPDQKRDVPVDEVVAKITEEAPRLLEKVD